MAEPKTFFKDLNALKQHIAHIKKGSMMLEYRLCPGYAGMVLGIMLFYDIAVPKYELDLQWMSFGLDLYGDTLQESYAYRFSQLESLMAYLEETYQILPGNIPTQFRFHSKGFPDPIKNADQKPQFEAAWQRFREDFKKGLFLDPKLELVYDSMAED